MGTWISNVCQDGQHRSCTGCLGCSCHHTAAPGDFREQVERARAEREEAKA